MDPRLEASLTAPRGGSDDMGDTAWPDGIQRASTSGDRLGRQSQSSSRHLVTEEEDSELFAMGAVLRTLAGCKDQGQIEAHNEPSSRVTWEEIEASCQKLDGTEIRISSLDLSCLGGVEESPGKAGANSTVFYNIKFEVDPTKKSQGSGSSNSSSSDCSLPGPVEAVLPETSPMASAPGGFETSYSFAASVKQASRSAPAGPRKSRVEEGSMSAAHYAPSPGHGNTAATLGPSPSGSAVRMRPNEVWRYTPLQHSASTASLALSADGRQELVTSGSLSSMSSPYSVGGDIFQAPKTQPAPKLQGAPSQTTSGPVQPQGSTVAPGEQPARGSSFPGAPSTGSSDCSTQAVELPEERRDAPVRYGSLVLPGAVPRKAKPEPTGVKKYLQAVKSKCGELFTSKTQGRQANAS